MKHNPNTGLLRTLSREDNYLSHNPNTGLLKLTSAGQDDFVLKSAEALLEVVCLGFETDSCPVCLQAA